MKCQTYHMIPGEPHLGRVRECYDTVEGLAIQEHIVDAAITGKTLYGEFDVGGWEFEYSNFLNSEQRDELEEIYYDLNDGCITKEEAIKKAESIIGEIEDQEVFSQYYYQE